MTGQFRDDYETAEVEGRKLDVEVLGKSLVYETAGFDPVMHMPAHPPGNEAIVTLFDDPHVKVLLDRWQIGFDAASTNEGELEYGFGNTTGTSQYNCLTNNPNTACGTARTFTMNTCGGGTTPFKAWRVSRTTPGYTYNEYVINQFCPQGSGGQSTHWYATKSCPNTGSGAQPSTCGTTGATAACKGCAGYPASAEFAGDVYTSGQGLQYCYLGLSEYQTCMATQGSICKQSDGTKIPGQCGCAYTCVCQNGFRECN